MTSPADILATRAGTSLEAVAMEWPTSVRRLKPNQVKNRVTQIRRAVRHGQINPRSATQLARLLRCNQFVFLHGYEHHVKAFGGDRV